MEISLRSDRKGGPLRKRLLATEEAFKPRRRFFFLVHGYNVSENEANVAYSSFENKIKKYSTPLWKDICRVYWPGDSSFKGLRVAWYPFKINPAKKAGELFAEYIGGRSGLKGRECEIIIVAHSLGCRLVIEAIQNLRFFSSKFTVILMAAAIPVSLVTNNPHVYNTLKGRYKSHVFFSKSDKVLSIAFRLGQCFSPGERELFPEAVGLKGKPEKGVWTSGIEMQGFGHGDYWNSDESAQQVLKLLRIRTERKSKITGCCLIVFIHVES